MSEKKAFTLRIPKDDFEIIEKNAQREKRSINSYISYHLTKEQRAH